MAAVLHDRDSNTAHVQDTTAGAGLCHALQWNSCISRSRRLLTGWLTEASPLIIVVTSPTMNSENFI